MDGDNTILKSWKWDPKAQHAGSPPREPVIIQLSDSLMLTYHDRSAITVKFAPCPGIAVEFACGERMRRTDTYLDHAHRATDGPQRGKLLIDQNAPTLQQRQKRLEVESVEKRNKTKPQSKDFAHDQIRDVVAMLERKFDGYEGCKVTPAADGKWREQAHAQSLREIPILPKTGSEVGAEPTFFGARVQPNDASETLSRLKDQANGKWLGSVEIHHKIVKENPVLKRSGPLTNASGRYSQELTVAGGGAKPKGEHLHVVSARSLDALLNSPGVRNLLVVVACLRADDRQSRAVEAVLEQVQLQLTMDAQGPTASLRAASGYSCHPDVSQSSSHTVCL